MNQEEVGGASRRGPLPPRSPAPIRPPAPGDTALPRWLAAIIIGAIALASGAALFWPALPFTERPSPSDVGVIRPVTDSPGTGGRIGATAPNFEWATAEGKLTRLSDLRGKVVVINFWATWCEPCRQEMPALQRVAVSEPDVVFLAVNLQEPNDKVRSFVEQLGLDRLQPVLDGDGAATRRFGVLSLPSTFFIDAEGVVRHLELGGPLSDDRIRTGIEKAR